MHANSLIYQQNQQVSGKIQQHERGNMTHHTDAERADCPVCGGKPFIRRSHDPDGMRWSHVECKGCGLRTRGKWVASSSDECPIYFQEVWDEWPRRAPAAPVPDVTDAMIEAANEAYCPFGDMHLAIQAALAAAPQPPDGLMRENPATKPVAAPVELPIPAAICTEVRTEFMQDFVRKEYGLQAVFGAKIEFNEKLYTEQQVRDLLAANGIGK